MSSKNHDAANLTGVLKFAVFKSRMHSAYACAPGGKLACKNGTTVLPLLQGVQKTSLSLKLLQESSPLSAPVIFLIQPQQDIRKVNEAGSLEDSRARELESVSPGKASIRPGQGVEERTDGGPLLLCCTTMPVRFLLLPTSTLDRRIIETQKMWWFARIVYL